MFVRVCAFVIWALVAATAVFWGLRLAVRSPEAPAHAVPVGVSVAARGDLSRLLGAAPVATAAAATASPETSSRFRLLGVMAPKARAKADPGSAASGQGVALIAVDGKPAKAYAVGAQLDTDLVLQAVSLRTASIGPAQGLASIKLEIPPLPPPTTGTLPNGAGAAAISAAPLVRAPAIPAVAPPVLVAPPPVAPPPVEAPAPSAASVPLPGSSAPRRDSGSMNR